MWHKLGQILSLAKGRDKVFKFLCYFSRFLAGFHLVPHELCGPLNLFARQLSAWRLTHRLADGFLQVRSISKSGWTGGEEDWLSALLMTLTNLADLFYYPADNIAWAGQHKILPISSETWFHLIRNLVPLLQLLLGNQPLSQHGHGPQEVVYLKAEVG